VIAGGNCGWADYLKTMKKLTLAIALTLFSSAGWAAEKLPLSEISDYLNTLTTAQAGFTQFNDDGSQSTGMLYVHRPGRMRFEYDPPEGTVVIASGGSITIHDLKSNQTPEAYPLRRTPLSILLARTVDLDRAKMVVAHGFDGTMTSVTAQDPQNPEYGSIDLMFSENPLELRGWVIRGEDGGQTSVTLERLQTGGQLSNRLFFPRPGEVGGDR